MTDEDAPAVGSWVRLPDEDDHHASVAFDGYEHELACGPTVQPPDEIANVELDREDVEEVCDACDRVLAGEDPDPNVFEMHDAPEVDPDDPPEEAVAVVVDSSLAKGTKATALLPGMTLRIPNDEPNAVEITAFGEWGDD